MYYVIFLSILGFALLLSLVTTLGLMFWPDHPGWAWRRSRWQVPSVIILGLLVTFSLFVFILALNSAS